ncbi:glycosyltransferase family 2 protein [Pseudomonas allii]|uniref:Glycosyltransferase family 2 protein n=2 Tax=Pseudomonas allii TaxID=2740531 RepID=A0ACC6LEG5_9PSED|nr:glycosyltransferase family 2 protein [Pseudomonas allii]KTB56233.1 glycosyl transferase family 2 [Pseudomonas fluorescens]MDR9876701.1 glycosyltransferase family 2 protein [Pseudomonas allii]NWN50098.1 glycosyltransferase family 2 protein [Pseudomonas allii]NWN61259.1 glycosyltransferase family 2 protein [Pseudomonas allii]
MSDQTTKIAVLIPSYKVKSHILGVIRLIGPEVCKIYVVDDCCPEGSGDFVAQHCTDERITVLRNPVNLGVGGAVMTGYRAAIADGIDIIVKIDGDGQMDPSLISDFVSPIIAGNADYTKGNRFFNLEKISEMPKIRLFGNAVLSFMTKLSSGYWELFDPTNGYTAIHSEVAKHLPLDKISQRYFFETDMLFRLNTLGALVIDIPMDAKYEDEVSNLKVSKVIGEFLIKHIRNFGKRIFYNYYLRGMSLASIELPLGLILLTAGSTFGISHWVESLHQNIPTPAGTVMLSALPVIIGFQLLLAFIGHDISSSPRQAFHVLRKKHILPKKEQRS